MERLLPSLRSDILAYLDRLSGDDLLADVDFRPLRASSIATYDRLLRQFLSALVQRGHDPQTLQSLADVVPLETVKLGLRFFIDRAAGAKSKQAYHIARLLTAIARHWAKVETHHLDRGRRDCRSGSA